MSAGDNRVNGGVAGAPLLVIAAGGTGGHMFPAQALAQEMLARGWRVALSTDARGLRYAGGFPDAVERRALAAATMARGGVLAKMASPLAMARGALAALRWFRAARPACVAGFGGYPAFPALTAAWALGLPRLIHEQNGVLGRVNRLFAARVGAVACGTWPLSNPPKGARVVEIGNPVRAAVLAARAPYQAPGGGIVELLIFGGSQGASVFATLIPAALAQIDPALRKRLRVVQQARDAELEGLRATYAAMGLRAECAAFFDDMPARLAAAHLIISRAGASTVAEIAAMGRPAILVPYPAAMDDHQTANARALAEGSAAVLAPEAGLTPHVLAGHLTRLFSDPGLLADMAAAARWQARPDAARKLADLVETLTAGENP